MYDRTTIPHPYGVDGYNPRPPICATWNRHWWLPWLVLVLLGPQVKALDKTYYSTSSSGTYTFKAPITVNFNRTIYYRIGTSGSWIKKNPGDVLGPNIVNLAIGDYQGLSSVNSPLTEQATNTPRTYQFRSTSSGEAEFTALAELPTINVTFYYGPGDIHVVETMEPIIIDIPATAGAAPVITNPNMTPPINTDWEKFWGKDIAVPYYVEGGATSIEVEIGGETYTFPVQIGEGDSGGVAMLNLPIPEGWDGMANINGQPVNLGPRIAYTGNPEMEYFANPYVGRDDLTLPPGMTWGQVTLPSGMVVGNSLPLPSTITNVTITPGMVDNKLPVGVTNTNGVTTYTTTGPITNGTNITIINQGSVVGSGSTGDPDHDRAILDSALPQAGDDVEAGNGLKSLPAKWENLKSSIQNKFGAFSPLQTGSLPKASSLDFTLPLPGMLGGNKNISMDLTANPWPIARALALVLVVMHAGFFFIKYLKV